MTKAHHISASLLTVGVFLAFFTTPALAEQKRIFAGSFGGVGSTTPNPYPLSAPSGIAVDEKTGDVYVADTNNHRVEKFGPSGEFILMFGKEVNQTAVLAAGSEAEQNVCTAASLDTCQAGAIGTAPGAFSFSKAGGAFLAVDEATGEVYVADSGDDLVSKFTEKGLLVTTWGDAGPGEAADGQLIGPEGQPSEQFGQLSGIAVDSAGNLWVDGAQLTHQLQENQHMLEFKQDGSFIAGWAAFNPAGLFGPKPTGIAVDSKDNLYLSPGTELYKYDSEGNIVGLVADPKNASTGAFEFTSGIAVDSRNVIYYATEHSGILAYASCDPILENGIECAVTESFGAKQAGDLQEVQFAVNSAGPADTLYAASRYGNEVFAFSVETVPDVTTGKPSALTSTGATINGVVNPAGVPLKECYFEWGETESYGNKAACENPGAGAVPPAPGEYAVHATIQGLHAGGTFHYRLVATNASDLNEPSLGHDLAFGPPLIDSESSAEVSATNATVLAELDPQNVDTRFRVEYGTSTEYGQSSPLKDVGVSAQTVPVELQGLVPGTVYHYRIVAENALGEGVAAVIGPDRTFTTQTAGTFGLPDGRQWEMVSPPDKHGAVIEPIGGQGWPIQAAASGEVFTFAANAPVDAEPAGYDNFQQVLSTRTSTGWSSADIALPHGGATGLAADGQEYRLFSEDLSHALVQPFGAFTPCLSAEGVAQPCISPLASEQTPFLRTDYTGGAACTSSCYAPLVTGLEGYADVPPGTVFGRTADRNELCPPNIDCGPEIVDAAPDLSHVVLQSVTKLTEKAVGGNGGPALYEWSADSPAESRLQLVSVLPGQQTGVGGELGGNNHEADQQRAISDDGSRVFWTDDENAHLYMRDTASDRTLQIDAPEPACVKEGKCGEGEVAPEFLTASSDGSRVVFADHQKLTPDGAAYKSNANAEGDLYECRIVEVAGALTCELSDIAPSSAQQGSLLGASEDASYVYFVADAILGDGAERGAGAGKCTSNVCTAAGQQLCNLYVRHEGTTKFIAVLSEADTPDWSPYGLSDLTARVSPNGQWLAFMSQRSLTGYDNRDAVSGQPDEEVFEYNAASDRLICASCDPTGARPHGVEFAATGDRLNMRLAGGDGAFWPETTWLAANIPTWTPVERVRDAKYQSRYLSNSGRLFFNSHDGLVPRDVNDQEDVYEFEPQGVPAGEHPCTSASGTGSVVFNAAAGGCVGLISAGTSSEESAFLDASETGGDVFFLTTAKLAPQDQDGAFDVYDAHECTSASPCLPAAVTPSPACKTTEECRAAPESQPAIFGAPSSSTFSGTGNVALLPASVAPAVPKKVTKKAVKCKRGFVKNKKSLCVKKPKKKAKAKKSAHINRRAS